MSVPIGGRGWISVHTGTAVGRYLARYEGRLEILDYGRPYDVVVSPGCGLRVHIEGTKAALAEDNGLRMFLIHDQATTPDGRWTANRRNNGSYEFRHLDAGSYTAVLGRSQSDVLTQPVSFEIPPGFHEGDTIPITLTFAE
jgi:hypothetical protein